jgi:hypothetical protein
MWWSTLVVLGGRALLVFLQALLTAADTALPTYHEWAAMETAILWVGIVALSLSPESDGGTGERLRLWAMVMLSSFSLACVYLAGGIYVYAARQMLQQSAGLGWMQLLVGTLPVLVGAAPLVPRAPP